MAVEVWLELLTPLSWAGQGHSDTGCKQMASACKDF